MSDVLAGIDRVYRRIISAIGMGTINTVKDTGKIQLVQVQLNPQEVIDTVPRSAEYGFSSNPLPGSHAILLFAGGERSNGVVIATGDARYRPTNLHPGEVTIHNHLGQSVTFSLGGIVVNCAGMPLTITNAPTVRVETPQFNVTGEIKDHCDTGVDQIEGIRVKYNEHTHSGAHAPFPDPQLPV